MGKRKIAIPLSRRISKKCKKGINEAQNKVALGLNALCVPAVAETKKLPVTPAVDKL